MKSPTISVLKQLKKPMKIKFMSEGTALMRQSKWIMAALVAAGGFTIGGSALAQDYANGAPTLSNVPIGTLNTAPNALYAGWADGPPITTFTSLPTGLEVQTFGGYGSLFNTTGSPVPINPNDNMATLTLTVNNVPDAQANVWIGVSFYLNDNVASYNLGGYAGMFGYTGTGTATWDATGDVLTEAVPITGALLTSIQAGGDDINGFNLQLDPAVYPGTSGVDVTFNSLVLSSVPEPASLALVGLGLGGLMAFRRRK
jgi:hypothetical protein